MHVYGTNIHAEISFPLPGVICVAHEDILAILCSCPSGSDNINSVNPFGLGY